MEPTENRCVFVCVEEGWWGEEVNTFVFWRDMTDVGVLQPLSLKPCCEGCGCSQSYLKHLIGRITEEQTAVYHSLEMCPFRLLITMLMKPACVCRSFASPRKYLTSNCRSLTHRSGYQHGRGESQ